MSKRLQGKIAFVTGAGSGFGREIALLFAEHGADIVCVDLNKDAAEATAKEISKPTRSARKCVLSLV